MTQSAGCRHSTWHRNEWDEKQCDDCGEILP